MRWWMTGMALAAILVFASSPVHAASPEPLPDMAWWRAPGAATLSGDPLAALDAPLRAGIDVEWAPLYRGADGARFERTSGVTRALSPPGRWRAGVEFDRRAAIARAGGSSWSIRSDQAGTPRAVVAIAGRWSRLGAALAAGGARGRAPGAALSLSTTLAPGWRADLTWSSWTDVHDVRVRWEDTRVAAPGSWRDERLRVAVAGTIGPIRTSLGQTALERHPDTGSAHDEATPELSWRGADLEMAADGLGARWTFTAGYGEGREALRVRRSGTSYGLLASPVSSTTASLACTPAYRSLSVRAWAGRWSGEARGSLALWPFEEIAAVAGTRRVVQSSVSLVHRGLAVERLPDDRAPVDGGVAMWWLAPRADYESWQGTLLGLGRDDPSSGTSSLRSATAIGFKLGTTATWHHWRLRLEGVQWIPLRVTRAREAAAAGIDPGDQGPGSGPNPRAKTWGGSILRGSLGVNW